MKIHYQTFLSRLYKNINNDWNKNDCTAIFPNAFQFLPENLQSTRQTFWSDYFKINLYRKISVVTWLQKIIKHFDFCRIFFSAELSNPWKGWSLMLGLNMLSPIFEHLTSNAIFSQWVATAKWLVSEKMKWKQYLSLIFGFFGDHEVFDYTFSWSYRYSNYPRKHNFLKK